VYGCAAATPFVSRCAMRVGRGLLVMVTLPLSCLCVVQCKVDGARLLVHGTNC
jgi:hypothetical protein